MIGNKEFFRIIDANTNRTCEGLRVIEDYLRFVYEEKDLSKDIRLIRHNVREAWQGIDLYKYRSIETDPGVSNSKAFVGLERIDEKDLLIANFKRIEESLRVMEEFSKISNYTDKASIYESARYTMYSLEKRILGYRLKQLFDSGIYGITDDKSGLTPIEQVKRMIEAGIKVIQFRKKSEITDEDIKQCEFISKLCKDNNALFIVNDHVWLATMVNAGGVHFGQEDIHDKDISNIRKNMIVGVSTHNEAQALDALNRGADYIGVGPVFETKTKLDVEPSNGLDYLRWVSENINVPYVSIGGITIDKKAELKENGGKIVAMISALTNTKDLSFLVKSFI